MDSLSVHVQAHEYVHQLGGSQAEPQQRAAGGKAARVISEVSGAKCDTGGGARHAEIQSLRAICCSGV